MKIIKIQYQCNYCGQMIDPDNDTVMSLVAGRIGSKDNFIPDNNPRPEDQYHYHDYCLKNLLTMKYEEQEEEAQPDSNKKIDTGRLFALHEAGWSIRKIADELGCTDKAVYYHIGKRNKTK